MTEVASVVVFTAHFDQAIAFYRALGFPLEDEDHGDGQVHAAGDLGGVHVAVLAAADPGRALARRVAGCTFVGLWVPSLDAAQDALERLGVTMLLGHEACEWGCRIVVEDPDGRPVEVNQRAHCPRADG